jgi:NADH:ubiquinone oxidoreductase subunit F (NADH-binding)
MLGAHYLLPDRPITTLDAFVAAGGGDGLVAAHQLGPSATIDEVRASGLRGRGGGGFPAGAKWSSVASADGGRHYVVANGAEGEPATFKDRMLMRRDPYRVIEGAAIAAFAVGADEIFVATKASYVTEVDALRRAAVELSESGLLGDLAVAVVEGPGDYLFGEEKALLEVIEGRDPFPRLLPPWQHGLFATNPSGSWEPEVVSPQGDSNPTVVNNVETLATAAHVLARGAEWFRTMGTPGSPGTVLATVVGAVRRPGVYEVELGMTFTDLLEECGGPPEGRRWRAALSGVSNAVLSAGDFDVRLTYEDMTARGTGLGAAGFVVYDDRTDMLGVARELSRFLAAESCGQCPPCKEGCTRITDRLLAIETGRGHDSDLRDIQGWLRTVTDGNRCYLGTQEQIVVSSILRTFPEDVAARLEGLAPPAEPVRVPLIEDITDDGVVRYADR